MSKPLRWVGALVALGFGVYCLAWAMIMLSGLGKSFGTGFLWLLAAGIFLGIAHYQFHRRQP